MKAHRVLVTGSRDWSDAGTVWRALNDVRASALLGGHEIVVVHGACPTGADAQTQHWADTASQFTTRPIAEAHPAQGHPTEDFGPWPAAGPRRNAHMVSLGANICLAFIGPCTSRRCRKPRPHPSHGATGCAQLAEQAGMPVRRWTA
ncbi:SLOG family protein [Streptomyces zhihengii]|uniref:SLOG family protein n=1 Tax=Streptomyces zhihengii TaxID=1818004 RepID=UPI00362844E5